MRRAFLCAVLFFGGVLSKADAQTISFVCNMKSQTTNVRSGPTAKDTLVVDRLANKTQVKILDRVKNPEGTHDWLKVEFKHSQSGAATTGYIFHEGVNPTCADTSPVNANISPSIPAKLEPQLELTLRGHGDYVQSAAFTPDGARIVTASEDKTTRLWDAKTGATLATLSGHASGVNSAVFSPDGTRIVTASWDKTAKLWDAKTGVALATLSGHMLGVVSSAFSPNGMQIITASQDGTAKLWDAKTGVVLATLNGHSDILVSAAFSPDGKLIVTASTDKTAKLWDAKTGAVLRTLRGHGKSVNHAAFSPDGTRIATASWDETAKLWDTKTGVVMATLIGHGHVVNGVAFSPDGAQVVTASGDKTAKLWDAKTGAVLATLSGHGHWVRSATFSPDGTRIVTASYDKAARIWLIMTRQQQQVRAQEKAAEQAARSKKLAERANALAALECEQVKLLDQDIKDGGQFDVCILNQKIKTDSARDLYLAAAKLDAAKERDKAKQLYQAIVDRFPNDDLALQAATRITAISDIESIEAVKSATEKAATESKAKADAEAQARAAQQRAEQERAGACSHVYVGKEIKQSVLGGFGLNIWVVEGFSAASQSVTIRSKTVGGTQEISCGQVPR